MGGTGTRRGTVFLRPRARLIRTIGKDLISNEVVALVELIKNAYDADAKKVRITFEEPLRPSEGSILIEDDGVGMTLDTVRRAWFEPATISKTRARTTASGRRVTGEKGIGRFAAARLAQTLELVTLAKGGKRSVRVRFDWGAFDDEDLYLDEVRCRWEESPARPKQRAGTTLRLIGLNDNWEGTDFGRLRGELARLVSPRTGKNRFRIVLKLPDRFREYAGQVTKPPILDKPHYRLHGSIDAKGQLSASYQGRDSNDPIALNGFVPVDKDRPPQCGPFSFEFKVWDREPKDLEPLARELGSGSTVRSLRDDLDAASGVSIYRDSFRVLLPENDWLRLDLRRVQNPTMRISNNQVVGAVFVSADGNPDLKDQTNREGIVSCPAYDDFKKVVVALLSRLEVRRDTHRRGHRDKPLSGSLFSDLDLTPIREFLEKRYPNDAELRSFLTDKTKSFERGVVQVQEVLARYRRLATLGQLIDVVLHDGRTPVATISNEATLGLRDLSRTGSKGTTPEKVADRLRTIHQQTEVLSTLFRHLAPFGGRKRGKPTPVRVEDIVRETFALHATRLAELHISVRLPESVTVVTVDRAEMQQILVNLLENAMYWLGTVPQDRREIAVEVTSRPGEVIILFSDSGPGIPDDVRDRIFDPYFSTKPEGVGLGLTIAGETAAEYEGSLELVSGGPLPGATFRVTLRRRIGDPGA